MGLLTRLLLRKTRIRKPTRDQFLTIMATAAKLGESSSLHKTSKAGIVFNPIESSFLKKLDLSLDSELQKRLEISGKSTETKFEGKNDEYGTTWITLDDPDFEDLVLTTHFVGETITQYGFGDKLIAAVLNIISDLFLS